MDLWKRFPHAALFSLAFGTAHSRSAEKSDPAYRARLLKGSFLVFYFEILKSEECQPWHEITTQDGV